MKYIILATYLVSSLACNPGKTIDENGHVDMGSDEYVDVGQFQGCTGLKSITGYFITSVYRDAFKDATQLESVNFPELAQVYNDAFSNTNPSIKMSLDWSFLEEHAFRGTSSTIEFIGAGYKIPEIIQDFANFKQLTFKTSLPTKYSLEQFYLADNYKFDFVEDLKSCDQLSNEYTSRCTCN